MEITSLFNLDKSRKALHTLEKLLMCTKCNDICREAKRHADCGNLLCACYAADSGTCPFCGEKFTRTNTSPDWHIRGIIGSMKNIKSLICGNSITSQEEESGKTPCETGETSKRNAPEKDETSEKTAEVLSRIEPRQEDMKQLDVGKSDNKLASTAVAKLSKVTCKEDKISHPTNPKRKDKIKDVNEIRSIMKRNAKGETKLHTACVKGDLKKVEVYLSVGADPCTKDNAGWTPLHEAVSKGNLDIVRLLLEAGAMVNVPGGYNNTPLHDAALGNHLEAARLLISYGANPELRNIEGFTPRYMAQTEEMKLILKDHDFSKAISPKNRLNSHQKDVVLYGINLSSENQDCLNTVIQRCKIKQAASYRSDVTHIVIGTVNRICSPSMDIFHGILEGKWIVDSQWLQACLENNKVVDPSEYEVTGTSSFPQSNAPRRSRINAEKMQPSLFNGFHVYFSGVDKITYRDMKMTKFQVSTLVTVGSGTVLTREPNPESIPPNECTVPYHGGNGSLAECSHLIIYQSGQSEPLLKYNMNHVKSLPVSWLLECIETFELTEMV